MEKWDFRRFENIGLALKGGAVVESIGMINGLIISRIFLTFNE
jgi:hypothetical protein